MCFSNHSHRTNSLDSNFDIVFDVAVALGNSDVAINELADILSADENELCDYDKQTLAVCNKIIQSGVCFSVAGDITSELVLPDDPEKVAQKLVDEDKAFREKTGDVIDDSAGAVGKANLGQPLNLEAEVSCLQHWGVDGHKSQQCPNDHIDMSPCNRELRRVIPKWFLADKQDTKYSDDEVQLPDGLDDQIRLSDHIPFTLDKKIVKQNSSQKKPPTCSSI